MIDENENDISVEELQEFMSADFFDVPADPAFKNRLREKLWELVDSYAFGYGPKHGASRRSQNVRRGRQGKK